MDCLGEWSSFLLCLQLCWIVIGVHHPSWGSSSLITPPFGCCRFPWIERLPCQASPLQVRSTLLTKKPRSSQGEVLKAFFVNSILWIHFSTFTSSHPCLGAIERFWVWLQWKTVALLANPSRFFKSPWSGWKDRKTTNVDGSCCVLFLVYRSMSWQSIVMIDW